MKYLTIAAMILLTGCADHITGTEPISTITKTADGSICEFDMVVDGRKLWYSCPCPDTVKVGDQVVLQFVRP